MPHLYLVLTLYQIEKIVRIMEVFLQPTLRKLVVTPLLFPLCKWFVFSCYLIIYGFCTPPAQIGSSVLCTNCIPPTSSCGSVYNLLILPQMRYILYGGVGILSYLLSAVIVGKQKEMKL